MKPGLLHFVRSRAAEIQNRWEALLALGAASCWFLDDEWVSFMIPLVIAQVVIELAREATSPNPSVKDALSCCGDNPDLSCFRAGAQAFKEVFTTVASQSRCQRYADEIPMILRCYRRVAEFHLNVHCGLCRFRPVIGSVWLECKCQKRPTAELQLRR